MSRGAQRTTRQLTDQRLAQQNSQIAQENQSYSQDRSLLMPTIQGLLNSQGYTPAHHATKSWRDEYCLRRLARARC
jgi:hypothetical protein